MGSYDCYCILCAGTLDIQAVTIGSMKEKNLRKRDRNVGIATGRLADTSDGENSCSSGTDSEEDDSGAEDAPDDEARKKRLNELQKQNEDDTGSDFEDEHGTSNSEYSEYSEDTESVDSNDFDLLAGATEITDVAMRPRTPEPKPTEERDSDSWSQTSDLSFDFDEVLLKDDAIEWDEDSFDPRLISREDLLWLNRSRALALNHKSDPENPKAYVSGRGRYEGLGTFVVRKAGRDPNDANVSVLDVTAYSDGEENMAFPFHEACFNIFANSMGHEKGHEVNKDVMWEVMRAHLVDERPALDVKYGYSMAHEQFWVNVPGEEYVVCDPGPRPSLRGKIPELLSGSILNRATEVLDLSNKVRSDPTQILPYDILLEIIGYMDTKDMLSFMKASYHVNSYTRGAAFWQHMIHVRILPWFNELGHFVENTSTDATDYKSLFLWSDALTRPDIGNQGPLMHIANRRRIWECCQPLASLYKRLVGPVEPAEPENSDEAKAILEASVCLSTPMTMYPSPNHSETTSAQFLHAWHEIGHRSCVLDTYWRHDPSQNLFLVGISITLGGQRRLFGSAEGSLGRPLHIERGEWINQIICDIDEINIFSRNSPNYDWSTYGRPEEVKSLTTCLIRDLQIKMTTGREKSVMNHRLATSQRPLVVLDNMHLVGLTGQIASNGAISRLGLLQASRLDSAPTARLQYDTTQQLFWKYLTRLPYQQRQYPIWSHPSYHHALFPMSTRISPFDPPEEMIPHDIFLWNKTCIEVFQPGGATIFNLPNQTVDGESAKESVPSTSATTTTCPITSPFPGTEASCTNTTSPSYQFQSSHEIAAINSGRTKIYSNQNSFVGCQTAAPAQHPRWTLDMNPHEETFRELWTELLRQNSQQYDPKTGAFKPSYEKDNIAFPLNNESITEVHVEHQYRALKLVTQSGRVGYFGLPGCKDWWVRKAVEGERFVGMSTCFGSLGGWSQTAMRWSHWKLSRVGVFFERVDEDGEVVSKEKQKILENNGDGKVFEQGKIEIVTTEEEDVA